MDQTAFRSLLDTSKTSGSSSATTSRPSLLSSGTAKSKKSSEPQPNFKPRKVTKKVLPAGYRDRATERRAGVNDYAEVEAIRDDFEKRAANAEDKEAVEQERRYLGGDETHTVLVKGLDYALLEQKKAQIKGTDALADDDALEEAFQAAVDLPSIVPKKRSRNDIISELKGKHAITSMDDEMLEKVAAPPPEVAALEKAKQMGKFKPIGVPSAEMKAKEEKRKKKKRKVVEAEPMKTKAKATTALSTSKAASTSSAPTSDIPPPMASSIRSPETNITPTETRSKPPPFPPILADSDFADDMDIFAEAGEYEGLDLGDEDEDDTHQPPSASQLNRLAPSHNKEEGDAPIRRGNWFNEPSPEPLDQGPPAQVVAAASSSSGAQHATEEGEGEESVPTHLAPLASSSITDVKAFLAMDKALEKEEKRKARKEKNKKKDS
ncbi:hypothetical protein FRB96_007261 [Tulasnella sp. 330]|nr:hypothetical protein FRB96_007261 [Tulasnella sp. 330]